MWRPDTSTAEQVKSFLNDLLSSLPEQLGIDEIIPGCEVTNLDPYGAGLGVFPRYIQVALRGGYHQDVYYRGGVAGLIVTSIITVIHMREGNRYEVLGPGGPGGTPGVAVHDHRDDTEGGIVPATSIEVDEIAPATYDDVRDWLNNTQSAGRISGGLLTPNAAANGTLDISAGTGFVKVADADLADTKFFDWGAVIGLVLADLECNYIYTDYDVGTGVVTVMATTDRTTIDGHTESILGRVWRNGNNLHIIQSGTNLYNAVWRNHQRLIEVRGFERAWGGGIFEVGARFLRATAGKFYLGANPVLTAAQDTSGVDRFTAWFNDGNWQDVINQQQIDNTQYNDYGVGLDVLTPDRPFGVHWVFIHMDGDIHVVYGQAKYKLAEAEAATLPDDLPDAVTCFGILAAKIIIEQNAANLYSVESAYVTFFPTSGVVVPDHLHAGGAGDGGQFPLDNLADVNVPAPANNDVLTYNLGTATWIAAIGGGGGFPPASPQLVSGGVSTLYATITLAIAAAAACDTIFIPPGTYNENITLKNGVCIVGVGTREKIRITGVENVVTTAAGGYLENVTVVGSNPPAAAFHSVVQFNHAAGVCYFKHVDIIGTNAANVTGMCGIMTSGVGSGTLYVDEVNIRMSNTVANATVIGTRITDSYVLEMSDFEVFVTSTDLVTGTLGVYQLGAGTTNLYWGRVYTDTAGVFNSLYQSAGVLGVYAARYNTAATTGVITYMSGDRVPKIVPDDYWFGLGDAAGRIVFDSTPVPDEVNLENCETHWDAAHDIYPDDAGRGIFARVANRLGIGTYDWHFRAGDPAPPTGYAWQAAPFVAPTGALYAYAGDYLLTYLNAANRSFMSTPITNAAAAWQGKSIFARVRGDNVTQLGIRFDDGTDNNYAEVRMSGVAANGTQNLTFVYRIAAGAVTTVASGLIVPVDTYVTIELRCVFTAPNYFAYGYVKTEDGAGTYIAGFGANFGAAFPAAGRCGIILENTAAGGNAGCDWLYKTFT